ncbi:hypothetical protein B0H17DRAFT_1095786 [Mycena rosella]|uniref:Uncharacterized protein n=1 Tax=Mycena rosella TaxID=1033263 RepID=A0AAD7CRN8_MYCRO|nr:hypothetical protein B0H17DRAFT_1095786 [Mycena rosella]
MAHGLRVPQIDLRAVLADQNPHIDLKVQTYETSTRSFLKAVGNYKTRTIALIADKRAAQAAEKKRTLERTTNVETETNASKMQEIQLVSDLQREQEERKEAELGVAAFKRQLATLRDRCAAIDSQIEHYRAIAGNLEREKRKEREHLSTLAAHSASEADSLESRLSCVVEGVDKDQLLVRIPSLSVLPVLVAHLHESKIFSFS